jgi:hypothetical protein
MAVQFINGLVFPPPAGFDPADPAAMAAMVSQMPPGAFIILVLGYLLGATAGCYTAARLAGSDRYGKARLVALVFIIGGIMNFRAIPHPTWVVAASFLAFGVAPFLAMRLARRAAPA